MHNSFNKPTSEKVMMSQMYSRRLRDTKHGYDLATHIGDDVRTKCVMAAQAHEN